MHAQSPATATPLTATAGGPLAGTIAVPGDKSISHRALMLGGLAVGETPIRGLLAGEDVLATAAAMELLGANVTRDAAGTITAIGGSGVGALVEPASALDMGNSGTGARLIMGLIASHPVTAVITGDASLSKRPMNRVIAPLEEMGAAVDARDGGRLPLTIRGAPAAAGGALPIEYTLPVASAQVKSAVLLAALNTPGETTVVEPAPTRDHTERMLRHFGVDVQVEDTKDGRRITVTGQPELVGLAHNGGRIDVPGDPSSAAFPLVAALLVPGSEVTLTGVGLNPLRTGLLVTLREMGAGIAETNPRDQAGEPVADLAVKAAPLTGVTVPADRAPSMIDEFPILAVAAACATGTTRFEGVGELRVKESDRLAAVEAGLQACGVATRSGEDWLEIDGCSGSPQGMENDAPSIATHLDHRIAMSFLVMGLACEHPVTIDDGAMIDTSFPGFAALMQGLGAEIESG